jgi:hypothetical protein
MRGSKCNKTGKKHTKNRKKAKINKRWFTRDDNDTITSQTCPKRGRMPIKPTFCACKNR